MLLLVVSDGRSLLGEEATSSPVAGLSPAVASLGFGSLDLDCDMEFFERVVILLMKSQW